MDAFDWQNVEVKERNAAMAVERCQRVTVGAPFKRGAVVSGNENGQRDGAGLRHLKRPRSPAGDVQLQAFGAARHAWLSSEGSARVDRSHF